MTLYFISGLGADRRIFEKLMLPSTHKIIFIDWIVPIKNETIENYALRLSVNINTSEPFSIIGLSFGGIVAIELSKILSPEKIILISSIPSHHDRPWYFNLLKILPIYKFIPKSFLEIKEPFVYKLMGVTNNEEQMLLHAMLVDTDINLFRWSVTSILNWEQTTVIKNLHHIHGSADQMFPIKYIKPHYTIKNGKHLMIYTNASEISSILTRILER